MYTDQSADLFEADEKYLKEVKSFYENDLEREHPATHFKTIECERNGSLLPIEEIEETAFSMLTQMNEADKNG